MWDREHQLVYCPLYKVIYTVLYCPLYCTVLYKVASGTWTTNFLRLSGFNQNLPKWQRYSKLHGASEGKSRIELQTKLRDDFTSTEKTPTGPISTFTFKNLLRNYDYA